MLNPLYFDLLNGTIETLYMVFTAGIFAVLLGLPLGILLFITQPKRLLPHALLNKSLALLVDVTRSIPFIILMLTIIPLTRWLVGSSIGTTAAIVPLSLAAIPFIARLTETSLATITPGLIEAGQAMGASRLQIVFFILLPEARPALIDSFTTTLINLVGYSAMAGAIGGGGLGDLAIRYGYQRFNLTVLLTTLVILITLVQMIQCTGSCLAKRFTRQ